MSIGAVDTSAAFLVPISLLIFVFSYFFVNNNNVARGIYNLWVMTPYLGLISFKSSFILQKLLFGYIFKLIMAAARATAIIVLNGHIIADMPTVQTFFDGSPPFLNPNRLNSASITERSFFKLMSPDAYLLGLRPMSLPRWYFSRWFL